MINPCTPLELTLEIQYTINIKKEKGRGREELKIYINISASRVWGLWGQGQGSSFQERVSHIYTLRLN